jgi:hypothetical protein
MAKKNKKKERAEDKEVQENKIMNRRNTEWAKVTGKKRKGLEIK